MDEVLSTDPEAGTARAQAGAYVGDLNAAVEPHGLKFAPDPAWRDKSAIGGAIGNNSTGSHSLKYGKTDHYVEELEVVLADGTVTTFGEVAVEELRESADAESDDLLPRIHAEIVRILDEEAGAIDERFPEMKRNVSGYNLDRLLAEYRGEYGEAGVVNLGRLMAGSEGTLATVTEATVSLVEIPETKAVALLTYDDLLDAMEDVAPILDHDPAAVEVMDDVLLGLAADTPEFEGVVGMLPEGTDSVLLVEFYADSDVDGKQKVADLIADRVGATADRARPATMAEPSDGAAETTSQPAARSTRWKRTTPKSATGSGRCARPDSRSSCRAPQTKSTSPSSRTARSRPNTSPSTPASSRRSSTTTTPSRPSTRTPARAYSTSGR